MGRMRCRNKVELYKQLSNTLLIRQVMFNKCLNNCILDRDNLMFDVIGFKVDKVSVRRSILAVARASAPPGLLNQETHSRGACRSGVGNEGSVPTLGPRVAPPPPEHVSGARTPGSGWVQQPGGLWARAADVAQRLMGRGPTVATVSVEEVMGMPDIGK